MKLTQPSGTKGTISSSNSEISVFKSIPYAPVSSLVILISLTPSSITFSTLSFISSLGYDPKCPLACFVLQYVHSPKHPTLIGITFSKKINKKQKKMKIKKIKNEKLKIKNNKIK